MFMQSHNYPAMFQQSFNYPAMGQESHSYPAMVQQSPSYPAIIQNTVMQQRNSYWHPPYYQQTVPSSTLFQQNYPALNHAMQYFMRSNKLPQYDQDGALDLTLPTRSPDLSYEEFKHHLGDRDRSSSPIPTDFTFKDDFHLSLLPRPCSNLLDCARLGPPRTPMTCGLAEHCTGSVLDCQVLGCQNIHSGLSHSPPFVPPRPRRLEHQIEAANPHKWVSNGRRFPKRVRDILNSWLVVNMRKPYPTTEEKRKLSDATGLTRNQLRCWFTRRRKHLKRRPSPVARCGEACCRVVVPVDLETLAQLN